MDYATVTLIDCHTDTTEHFGKKYNFLEDRDSEYHGQDSMQEFDLRDPDGPEDFTLDYSQFDSDREAADYGLKTVTDWIEGKTEESPKTCWVLHYLAWEKNVLPHRHTVVKYWW